MAASRSQVRLNVISKLFTTGHPVIDVERSLASAKLGLCSQPKFPCFCLSVKSQVVPRNQPSVLIGRGFFIAFCSLDVRNCHHRPTDVKPWNS